MVNKLISYCLMALTYIAKKNIDLCQWLTARASDKKWKVSTRSCEQMGAASKFTRDVIIAAKRRESDKIVRIREKASAKIDKLHLSQKRATAAASESMRLLSKLER